MVRLCGAGGHPSNLASSYVSLVIAACPFVGITKTLTLLSQVLISASFAITAWFASGSSRMSICVNLAHILSRSETAFSPTPPVEIRVYTVSRPATYAPMHFLMRLQETSTAGSARSLLQLATSSKFLTIVVLIRKHSTKE